MEDWGQRKNLLHMSGIGTGTHRLYLTERLSGIWKSLDRVEREWSRHTHDNKHRALNMSSSFTHQTSTSKHTTTANRNHSSSSSFNILPLLLVMTFLLAGLVSVIRADECQLTPVIHVLQYPGCIPKPIPSFACTGKCTSYVQVNFCFQKYNSFDSNYI